MEEDCLIFCHLEENMLARKIGGKVEHGGNVPGRSKDMVDHQAMRASESLLFLFPQIFIYCLSCTSLDCPTLRLLYKVLNISVRTLAHFSRSEKNFTERGRRRALSSVVPSVNCCPYLTVAAAEEGPPLSRCETWRMRNSNNPFPSEYRSLEGCRSKVFNLVARISGKDCNDRSSVAGKM